MANAQDNVSDVQVKISGMPSDPIARTASASFAINGGAGGSVNVHLSNFDTAKPAATAIRSVLEKALAEVKGL